MCQNKEVEGWGWVIVFWALPGKKEGGGGFIIIVGQQKGRRKGKIN